MRHNKLTHPENLKIWSLQFEKDEWDKLCGDQVFLDIIMDDHVKAAVRAGEILGRNIEPF